MSEERAVESKVETKRKSEECGHEELNKRLRVEEPKEIAIEPKVEQTPEKPVISGLDSANSSQEAELTNTASTTKPSKSSKSESINWHSWSHEEEVFLTGAVINRFFSRGSLSSTKKESTERKNNCWESIKYSYDQSYMKFSQVTGNKKAPIRSENALSRHFKVMKERSISKNSVNVVDFRAFYKEWEESYNSKYTLIEDTFDPNARIGYTDNSYLTKQIKGTPSLSRGRWSYVDEVLLIGVVMEVFFQRGSLSSSHKERQKKCETDFWKGLHKVFEEVRDSLGNGGGSPVLNDVRTPQALARHFKVMKVKLLEADGKMSLKSYFMDWERDYRKFWVRTQGGESTSESAENKPVFRTSASFSATQENAIKILKNSQEESNEAASGYECSPSTRNIATFLTSMRNGRFAQNDLAPPINNFGTQSTANNVSFMANSGNMLNAANLNNFMLPFTQALAQNSAQNQMMIGSPNHPPIVTTSGNATTYWMPLTLYNNNDVNASYVATNKKESPTK